MKKSDRNTPPEQSQLADLAADRLPIYETANSWFLEQGPEIISVLVHGLEDDSLGSLGHSRILRLLALLGQNEMIPVIRETLNGALRHKDHLVATGAMEALGLLSHPEATEALIALLHVDDTDIVKQAAALLGHTRDQEAVEPLVELLSNDDPHIRYSAAKGLTQFDDPSVHALLRQHGAVETDAEVRELLLSGDQSKTVRRHPLNGSTE